MSFGAFVALLLCGFVSGVIWAALLAGARAGERDHIIQKEDT